MDRQIRVVGGRNTRGNRLATEAPCPGISTTIQTFATIMVTCGRGRQTNADKPAIMRAKAQSLVAIVVDFFEKKFMPFCKSDPGGNLGHQRVQWGVSLYSGATRVAELDGMTGRLDHPKLIETVVDTIRKARAAGRRSAILVVPGPMMDAVLEAGCELIICGGDMANLTNVWTDLLAQMRQKAPAS